MSEAVLAEGAPLRVRVEDAIATVLLDRPDALNAISTHLAESLASQVAAIAERTDVRVVVVASSSPRAFCVGADLRERSAMTVDDLVAQRPTMSAAYDSLASLGIPTIAAVEGFALGGGFELALACDLLVADDTAVFGFPEASVGLIPGGGGPWQLASRIGVGRTADLVMTARRLSSDEADRWGLVSRTAPTGRAAEVAGEVAQSIARNAPLAVRHAKASLVEGLGASRRTAVDIEDGYWRRTVVTNDRAEGVAAFAEKRPPQWSGS